MAGYMLLYLACLRALTVCLATVSSSRLLFIKMIMMMMTHYCDFDDSDSDSDDQS